MAKVVLGSAPKSFKKVVSFDGLDGAKLAVEVSFIYRTKTAFGAFLDEMFEQNNIKPASNDDDEVRRSIESVFKGSIEHQAGYLNKIMDGWNLDADLSFDSLHQLCDEFPGAAFAIIETYRAAITEGRLGN